MSRSTLYFLENFIRLCVCEDDRSRLLDPTAWPDSVIVSEWFIKANQFDEDKRIKMDIRRSNGPRSMNVVLSTLFNNRLPVTLLLLLLWRRRRKTMSTVTTRSWQQRIWTVSVMASDGSKRIYEPCHSTCTASTRAALLLRTSLNLKRRTFWCCKNTGSHQPNCVSLTVSLIIFHSGVQPCLVVWKQVCFVEDLMTELWH